MTQWTAGQLDSVRTTADRLAPQIIGLSHALADDPELGYEEHRSMARCADLLEQHGVSVERGCYGLPTAFAARSGSAGPHVVLCAEYDALPGVGHACGHNIIAASAVGAGLVLAPLVEGAGLRVTVLGTPAEEVGGGKVDLLHAGAFEGAHAALMMHPAPFDAYASDAGLAVEEWRVVYTGRATHASYAPEQGLNALDGLVQGYLALGLLRQHLRPGQQVHGVVLDGGEAANVIPARTEGSFYLRAKDLVDLDDLRTRARGCLEGAATATGTTVEIRTLGHVFEPFVAHAGLAEAFTRACEVLGRPLHPAPDPDDAVGGSTDFGNVSQVLPALHADMSVDSWPVVNHQPEFATACVGPSGDRALLDAVQALALTALAVASDPDLVGGTEAEG